MDEIVKVSIAGIGFSLDREAYDVLRSYLDSLAEKYASDPDGNEIITDIEARIVELILSKHAPEEVVPAATVKEIIGQMGMPEDAQAPGAGNRDARNEDGSAKFPRRLYRNMEGAKLGGVCNGLATFFDADPAWIRVAFLSPLLLVIIFGALKWGALAGFMGSMIGVAFLLYFILWAAIPAAKNPRQKLEMKGERITASSIGKGAGEEPANSNEAPTVWSHLFSLVGQILIFFVKFVLILIAIGFVFAAIGILIALGALIFGHTGLPGEWGELLKGVEGVSLTAYIAVILGGILLPIVVITYQIIRMVFGLRNSRVLMWILCGGWSLLLIIGGIMTYNIGVRDADRFIGKVIMKEGIMEHNELDYVVINGDTVVNIRHTGEKMRQLFRSLGDDIDKSVELKDNTLFIRIGPEGNTHQEPEIMPDSLTDEKIESVVQVFEIDEIPDTGGRGLDPREVD